MKTKIVLIFLICLVTFSCKKEQEIVIDDNNNAQNPYYDTILSPYLIQNFLFNNGTYWIYKDSITNIFDTCKVDSTITGIQVYNQLPTVPHQGGYIVYFKYAQNIRKSNFPCGYAIFSKYLFMTKIINDERVFMFATSNNNDFQLSNRDEFFTNYTIDTTNYSNIYKFYYQNPSTTFWPGIPDSGYYYMKAGIGIIKSEYYNNGQKSVYELMDYHIN